MTNEEALLIAKDLMNKSRANMPNGDEFIKECQFYTVCVNAIQHYIATIENHKGV